VDLETGRALEAQVKLLLTTVRAQQEQLDALSLRLSQTCEQTNQGSTQSLSRLTVSVAVPCIPRHLDSLRKVLGDIHNQTVMPLEVVVSLSETTDAEGASLELSLRKEFFSGPLPSAVMAGRQALADSGDSGWPTLTIFSTTERKSHAQNCNRAAGKCTGDVVSWFDADDRMHPRRTEVLEQSFRELKVAAVLHGMYAFVDGVDGSNYFESQAWVQSLSSRSVPHSPPSVGLVSVPLAHMRDSNFFDPHHELPVVLGEELFDAYSSSQGGLDSLYSPDGLIPPASATHGHVSVDRRKVLSPPTVGVGSSSSSSGVSSDSDGLGLRWADVPTGGQAFGEDVRFLKSILSSLGRDNSTLAVVGANLTLYSPSWGASKRCVVGPKILFDCRVTVDPETGVAKVDYSSYDTVFNCPEGTQPGLYHDETAFHKGVRCVAPSERGLLAPGIRYLDGFEITERKSDMEQWQVEMYKKFGVQ